MKELTDIIGELLTEGLDDWVPVDQAVWLSREADQAGGPGFRETTLAVLRALMEQDLMAPGDIGESGFAAWSGTTAERIERAERELRRLDWAPQGGAFWLANTPAGDRWVRGDHAPGG